VVVGPHLALGLGSARVLETSRIGVRLRTEGVAVTVRVRADLPSLGVLPGTIQVLPSGDWVVLGPDAGTMGGYPIVGVLAGDGLDRWAHLQPGARVTLTAVAAGSVRIPPLERVIRVGEIS
jgi:allophanate hydrolase subunit 2